MYRIEIFMIYVQTRITNLKIEIHQEYTALSEQREYLNLQKVNYRPTLPKHSKVGR
jgi:hypothetical protein